MDHDRRKLLYGAGIAGGALLPTMLSSASAVAAARSAAPGAQTLTAAISAADVEFLPAGAGAVARTVQQKERDIVHADDWGLLGDGSDETVKLQNLFDAAQGKLLLLGAGKTYGFSGSLLFPDNTTLAANGSRFKRRSVSPNHAIVIGADTVIDRLSLETAGVMWNPDPGVIIEGSRVQIGSIQVDALVEGTGGIAVTVGTEIQGSAISNVQIGHVTTTNYRGPMMLFELQSSTIGFVEGFKYERGIYIRDCRQVVIRGGCMHSIWANTINKAGANGILIESVQADYACRDIFIHDFVVKISGEHGFRIGGALSVKNVHHINCASHLAGSGIPDAGGTSAGGAGFKALGVISGSTPHLHEDLQYVHCHVEDGGQENSNWSAFILGLCKGVTLGGCRVRRNTRPFSSMDGIWIDNCINVDVASCSAIDCRRYALRVSSEGNIGSANITVTGGHYHIGADGFGEGQVINVSCRNGNIKNLSVNGASCRGGAVCVRGDTLTGTYGLIDCSFNLVYRDPASTTGGPPFQVPGTVILHVNAPWYGTYSSGGSNGSVYQDVTQGRVLIRKSTAWAVL